MQRNSANQSNVGRDAKANENNLGQDNKTNLTKVGHRNKGHAYNTFESIKLLMFSINISFESWNRFIFAYVIHLLFSTWFCSHKCLLYG